MLIYITAVHMSPSGSEHQHIERLKYTDSFDGSEYEDSRRVVVRLIGQGHQAKVADEQGEVDVLVVKEGGKEPYLRTYADGRWTDNLLALERY